MKKGMTMSTMLCPKCRQVFTSTTAGICGLCNRDVKKRSVKRVLPTGRSK